MNKGEQLWLHTRINLARTHCRQHVNSHITKYVYTYTILNQRVPTFRSSARNDCFLIEHRSDTGNPCTQKLSENNNNNNDNNVTSQKSVPDIQYVMCVLGGRVYRGYPSADKLQQSRLQSFIYYYHTLDIDIVMTPVWPVFKKVAVDANNVFSAVIKVFNTPKRVIFYHSVVHTSQVRLFQW